MSYQVLARKWRPRRFEEMVGQEHVLKAIINALDNDRLHHAYLFTGTRGVGKTTIARIFSKSLNCEQGIGSKPCGVCTTCREIDEGRFVDLLEVDAASRTKVEDTRELLENVQYTPTRGRYKVYLIDEVHMLSNSSFNALLKTLEEPPPHVKFLLATTDPQRLPVTVLSRCLQFNLKRLPLEMISNHLKYILQQENVQAEAGAVALIAKGADGSMRDALSLLDQGIAHSGGALSESDIRAMLGTIDRAYVYTVMDALVQKDAAAVLDAVQAISEQVPDFSNVMSELLSLMHAISVQQLAPGKVNAVDLDETRIAQYAQQLQPEEIQLFYQIALLGRRDLDLAPDPRTGFEMALLRMMAFAPTRAGAGVATAAPSAKSAPVARQSPMSKAAPPTQAAESRPVAVAPVGAPAATATVAMGENAPWREMVSAMRLEGLLYQMAANCALTEKTERRIQLTLSANHASLYNKKLEARLQQSLETLLGRPVVLEIIVGNVSVETPAVQERRQAENKMDEARQALDEDANVQALKDMFSARVVPESIRPVK